MTKTYTIERSPLYRLRNKRKLAVLLKTELSLIASMDGSRELYSCYEEPKKNGTGARPIENPCAPLKQIQKKLLTVLARIITPDWLKSGKKGDSYITNAIHHQKSGFFLCVDIKSFYQSIPREFIFRAFKHHLKMSDDVAWLITDLTTIKTEQHDARGYIPTGAPTSQLITFYAHHATFLKLHEIAISQNIVMSVFVDDITFSSNKSLPKDLLFRIERALEKVGLSLKWDKVKKSGRHESKLITGVVITPEGSLETPHKLCKKIRLARTDLKNQIQPKKTLSSLLGLIEAGKQIKPGFMEPQCIAYRGLAKKLNEAST